MINKKEITHGFNQSANDWITCKCGMVFSNSRKGNVTARDKFEEHLISRLNFRKNGGDNIK